MTTPNVSPFSLRPWPIGDKKPKNLGEFIARVNAERGGFRNVTEAQLREEIAAQEDGRVEIERSSDEEEEEEETDADKTKNIVEARDEVLRNLEVAHQSAMLCLDFVSLLLSKEKPSDTSLPLSEALRERVGIGTLGASKLKESNVTEARRHDDRAIATGWRLMGINNMVDSVVAAAEKLEKEMELETKYWADVLAVSENGWAVCALPQEPHTLGVRFGFAESAPEFRNSSIAPLRRNDDGTVRMDLGRVGKGSQRVRITLKKNGVIMDQSPLPGRTPEDAPLQDRVLEARNTIFHQELWYEINREARNLVSSDVYSDTTAITWKQDQETKLIFTLEDLAEPDNTYETISNFHCSCTAYSVYMQFLLYQGHRQNYHRRTTMTQLPNSRVTMHQPYAILRAVIANSEYFRGCQAVAEFLNELTATLRRAGISTASCKSTAQPLVPALLQGGTARYNSKMELNFINHLVGRLESVFELAITPEAKIYARGRIVIVPYIGMLFGISLAPFSPHPGNAAAESNTNTNTTNNASASEDKKPSNPLEISYPPSDAARDPYPSAREAIYYVRQAAIRAVAQQLAEGAAAALGRDDVGWAETARGPAVTDRDDKEARVDITVAADGRLELTLDAQWRSGRDAASRRWAWRADRGDATGEGIAEAVLAVMRDHPELPTEV
ncbi:subunit 17 of mediator complex-domain-containing protein [Hypoxylon cercidicola]|nr:subunit 17 of mediator complex-domain-containing protein [Hypoxylon cercidicola]